jgi:transposase
MVAYAQHYSEQQIPYGSLRRPVALHRGPHLCPAPQDKDAPGFTAYGPILDAVFFYVLLRAALPFWRLLPRDYFPPWKTLYDWFRRRWRIDGTFERLNAELRERLRARLLGTKPAAQQRRHSGLPVRQDHGSGRQRARLGSRQEEGGGNKAPPAGLGHRGTGAQGAPPQCQGARPRRRHQQAAIGPGAQITLRAFSHLLWVDSG